MDKFVSGVQVNTVSGGPVQGAVFSSETAILKSIQRQIFNSKYKNETNPEGNPPTKKSDEELNDYITNSGY
jgi:hypothetical protein